MQTGALFEDPAVTAAMTKSRRKRGSRSRTAEDEFAFQCRAYRLPDVVRQLQFAKKAMGRKWQLDFAFPEPYMLAVEIEGLVVTTAIVGGKKRLVSMGRHAHADGFREDCRKYAAAAQLGWTVIRFEAQMVKTGEAIEMTMRLLSARGWKAPA